MTVRAHALWVALAFASVLAAGSLTSRSSARANGHGPATGTLDCSACHTPQSWRMSAELRGPKGFDHDRTGFPLRAGHQRAACVQCHDGRTTGSHDCSACHADEHAGKLGQDCDRCHSVSSFQLTDPLSLHSRTRLPLTGMHALVACTDCHRSRANHRYSAVPSQCFACHEADYRRRDIHPVHDGSQGAAPFPRDCAECHRTSAFSPAIVEASQFLASRAALSLRAPPEHDRAFVLSYGPHAGAACASCHADLARPRWTRCTGCHAHNKASLTAQHPSLGEPTDGSCLACHPGGAAR